MTAPVRGSNLTVVNVALGARAYDIVIGRGVLFLRPCERPDFVELQSLVGKLTQRAVPILGAGCPDIDQELGNGVARNIGQPACRPEAVAFDQKAEDLNPFGQCNLFMACINGEPC